MSTRHIKKHGVVRGLDSARSSSSFEGRFGRLFRTLPKADYTDEALNALAAAMSAPKDDPPTPETEADDEESSVIHAGYTYLGQFIDHDITFDPASSLQKQNDPDALVDYRTPAFDLDNIYGRGPDDQPYLYEADGKKFVLGSSLSGNQSDPNTKDLPRNNPSSGDRRAIIGDPRNDENVIVSQLQGMFLRFHNRMADMFPGNDFKFIQAMVRWHYQWVVINDFLPTIIGQNILNDILPHLTTDDKCIHKNPPNLKFFKWKNEPFMPVEFSVAAYRFGHSMVRPIYRLNAGLPRFEIFSTDPNTNLQGFREFPSSWAIDWHLFFDFGNYPAPNPLSAQRIQPAYKIDTSLVNPLANLPSSVAVNPGNLALRNLQRGRSLGLPSGQDVARRMCIPVIPDNKLFVGKANEDGMNPAPATGVPKNPTIDTVHPSFKDKSPLWFYILAEAQQAFVDNNTPLRLGPVGGRIVGEVFVGLLLGDKHSYLSQQPGWAPIPEFQVNGKFGIAELLKQAMQA